MKMITETEYEALRMDAGKEPINIHAAALLLVAEAAKRGLVLTIEQRSVPPLAMGRYVTDVLVRAARN